MALQTVSQPQSQFIQSATFGLLVLQAAIATTVINTFVSTESVLAQTVKVSDESITQLPAITTLGMATTSLVSPQAAACWPNPGMQNCSHSINLIPSNRISQYPPELVNSESLVQVIPAEMPQAKNCWLNNGVLDCLYTISSSAANRLNPYPVEQLNALPNFDPPVNRSVIVRIPF